MEGVEAVQPVPTTSDTDNKVDGVVEGPLEGEGAAKVPPEQQVTYPMSVIYCGNCGLPPEVCILKSIVEIEQMWMSRLFF